ncbi:MAG: hypothetical protein IKJ99_06090 [Oscillospiraceae bacterium]|nr:hypothetical protein [Oscillospiraceae bacterium]
MERNQNRKNVREITGYEAVLVKALEAAVQVGLNSGNICDHIGVYNDLFEAGYNFIEKIVLRKYRVKLESCKIDSAEVANSIAAELFWKKLDYIMNSSDPVCCRGLINETAKWRVYDFIRSDKCARNDVDTEKDGGFELQEDVHHDSFYSTANVHLTMEAGWNLIASDVNLEEDAILYDSCMEVLGVLKENRNAFDVISFLGTKVVGYKAGELAEDFINLGRQRVSSAILKQTVSLFGLDRGFFDDAAFDLDAMALRHCEAKKLAAEISRGSDRARNKAARRNRKKTR